MKSPDPLIIITIIIFIFTRVTQSKTRFDFRFGPQRPDFKGWTIIAPFMHGCIAP